jgi:antirestriction protein
MTKLFAQPYDISANGFYFEDAEDYQFKASKCRNDYGDAVEEFEIQFIDGERIDSEFASAFQLSQVNLGQFFELTNQWDNDAKIRFIIANGECGYGFNPDTDDIHSIDIDIYGVESLEKLAEQFIDEGFYGEIPAHLQNYIDVCAIARDLSVDYAMAEIAGNRWVYRCG